jgi:hypothetical protein
MTVRDEPPPAMVVTSATVERGGIVRSTDPNRSGDGSDAYGD